MNILPSFYMILSRLIFLFIFGEKVLLHRVYFVNFTRSSTFLTLSIVRNFSITMIALSCFLCFVRASADARLPHFDHIDLLNLLDLIVFLKNFSLAPALMIFRRSSLIRCFIVNIWAGRVLYLLYIYQKNYKSIK